MKVSALSLGCKANSYDTDTILSEFERKGYEIVHEHDFADIFIINTCSVTNIAERKSRQAIERVLKLNPDAVIVVTGCYAQIKPEEVKALRNVAVVVGTRDRKNIVALTEEYFSSGKTGEKVSDVSHNSDFEDIDIADFRTRSRTRFQLKIQDGCNNFCTYCIIPYARGRICSKPMEKVLQLTEIIKSQNINEVVLTGIHIASYGKDGKNYGLADLLEAIDRQYENTGIRVRLGSLDPSIITEEFVKRISALKSLCPQFHLSLQSGSDTVLKRMNRHYSADEYYNGVCLLRKYFGSPSITTDIIVGFPGETEEEFCQTLEFAKKVSFAKIHIFPYSRRDGTVAAKMPDQIPHSVAVEREKRLSEIESRTRREYIEACIGKEATVLFEEVKETNGYRYSCGYTPEYVYVKVKGDETLNNTLRRVRLIKAENEFAFGELI